MSRKLYLPVLVLFLLSLACSFSGTTPTAQPAATQAAVAVQSTAAPVVPTEAPAPTQPPAPTAAPQQPTLAPQPTEPPAPEATETPAGPQSFTESFDDSNLPNWKTFYVAGTEKFNDIFVEDSKLKFNINTAETYAYAYNENQQYKDVIVSADVTSTMNGDNGIALMCRVSDRGWYELRYSSQSYFWLYRYDQIKKDKKMVPYVELIPQTVIRQINPGNKSNKVSLACIGDELHVFFNGTEILYQKRAAIVDETYKEGYVGVGAMTFTTTKSSVQIEFEEVSAEAR